MKTIVVTPDEMAKRTARFASLKPYSQQSNASHGIPVEAIERVSARRVYPVMAPSGYTGRSAQAPVHAGKRMVLSIPESPPGDGAGLHVHARTTENFLCLSGRFEISWGDKGAQSVELGPLDFISMPKGVYRAFKNVGPETGRLLAIIECDDDRDAADPVYHAPVTHERVEREFGREVVEKMATLGFDFATKDTKVRTPTAAEMKKRMARFADLQPYSRQNADKHGIPTAAMERLTAHRVYPVMVPESYTGRSAAAPVHAGDHVVLTIAECPPGNGPGLHCHETTTENFFCLNGRFEVTWGDEGENRVVLEPNDFVSVPPGVSRAFRNLSDETARLFVAIETEGPGSQDRVAYAPALGEEVARKWGTQARDKLEEIGFRFDAGVEA